MEQTVQTEFHLPLLDWQYNAGIVGFCNIIKAAGKEDQLTIRENDISFSSGILQNFSEDYFAYLIEVYRETTSWYKIVSFKETIEEYEAENYESFAEKDIKKINDYIVDVAKKYIKSNSYKSVYGIVANPLDILQLGNNLKKVDGLKKKDKFEQAKEKIISEVKERVAMIKKMITYFEDPEVAKHILAKNVLYTVVKNGWNGVSVLNPQTKEKDVYIDFEQHFVEPCLADQAVEQKKKEKYKWQCACCNQPIKDTKNAFSFLVATGFDINRKNAHAWDFNNDLGMCSICRLIYACVPAGFVYLYDQGIFINANTSLPELLEVKNRVKVNLYTKNRHRDQEKEKNKGVIKNIYAATIRALLEEEQHVYSYEKEDVQIVRYSNERYYFTLLSKVILHILSERKEQLNRLVSKGFKEGKETKNLYQEVVSRLLNSENLYLLIYKLLRYKSTTSEGLYYNSTDIMNLIQTNQTFLGGIQVMEKKLSYDELEKIKQSGWYFRKDYSDRSNANKVNGIVYKFLNALKSNNRDVFMDVMLNCYSYLGKATPKWTVSMFEDEELFKTIGYSFVSGIIGEEGKNKKDGENK